MYMQISMPKSFPRPFVITVGVPKGGDCKSWTALNLASRLGCWGYDVVAIDANQMHDLQADHAFLGSQGLWPRFDVISHDPLQPDGNQTEKLDISAQRHRDFIIYDTAQYVQLRTTRWAWSYCHLMILPVTPSAAQTRNYFEALQLYAAMQEPRAPMLVLPCRTRVLRNSAAQKKMEDLLGDLKNHGCIVPQFPTPYMIPESELVLVQDTRWIFSETEYEGKKKVLPSELLVRMDISLAWIRSEIETLYGPFPAPRLPVLDPGDRGRLITQLSQEHAERCAQRSAVGREK
jgi:hypothetical protein